MKSKFVTIFEGPDGAGKTTAAVKYAKATNALYVHCGAFPEVNDGLPRMYAEAMMPAVLGVTDVVMDRGWQSELPYGVAYRDLDRLARPFYRMLDRLALRCSATIIWCNPGWAMLEDSFIRRKGEEYLDSLKQLRAVADLYVDTAYNLTSLCQLTYDYRQPGVIEDLIADHDARPETHPLRVKSAGTSAATTVLIGDKFTNIRRDDPLHQWPFANFDYRGCSAWFTERLEDLEVAENQLLWVNADQDLGTLWPLAAEDPSIRIICMGKDAVHRAQLFDLHQRFQRFFEIRHPQYVKRFYSSTPYSDLAEALKS